MPTTDVAIRNAIKAVKDTDKPLKLFDGGGLFLHITPAGGKYWRLKYRMAGKEKLLSLGVYPEVGLAAARKKRDTAREKIAAGVDPGEAKKAEQRAAKLAADNSFEAVARDWLEERKSTVEEAQHIKTLARLVNDVFPWIGNRPITQIDAPEILAVLKRIDGRGARFSAHRVRSEISRVFRYAIKEGEAKSDPAKDLIGAIRRAGCIGHGLQPNPLHQGATDDDAEMGGLLG